MLYIYLYRADIILGLVGEWSILGGVMIHHVRPLLVNGDPPVQSLTSNV